MKTQRRHPQPHPPPDPGTGPARVCLPRLQPQATRARKDPIPRRTTRHQAFPTHHPAPHGHAADPQQGPLAGHTVHARLATRRPQQTAHPHHHGLGTLPSHRNCQGVAPDGYRALPATQTGGTPQTSPAALARGCQEIRAYQGQEQMAVQYLTRECPGLPRTPRPPTKAGEQWQPI